MATITALRARLTAIDSTRFAVRAPAEHDMAQYSAETVVSAARPLANATAIITVSDHPEDYAVDLDSALSALAGANTFAEVVAALEANGAKLDLRRRPTPQASMSGSANRMTKRRT